MNRKEMLKKAEKVLDAKIYMNKIYVNGLKDGRVLFHEFNDLNVMEENVRDNLIDARTHRQECIDLIINSMLLDWVFD